MFDLMAFAKLARVHIEPNITTADAHASYRQ
jgi:hypothetical protein